jgi:hypothetical protein
VRISEYGGVIKGMKSCMPMGDYVRFRDEDGFEIVIETDVVLRIASLIEFENSRFKEQRDG